MTAARLDGGAAALRGVYLPAGSAAVELYRAGFPDHAVDVAAHRDAYGRASARDLAGHGFNLAILSMSSGFPPERELKHWREFSAAVAAYRDAGMHVIGRVETSSCMAVGSYARRDWYALTPAGRRIPCYGERFLTCWNALDWREEVATHTLRALEGGADGVFFDDLTMGVAPSMRDGTAGGFAGCACRRCRETFVAECGARLPLRLSGDVVSQRYVAWRASVIERALAGWAARMRVHQPAALVLASHGAVALRDTRTLFGVDPQRTAAFQDAVVLESVAMPRFERDASRLVNNALATRVMRALAPDRPLLAIARDNDGEGGEVVDAGALRRAIAEVAAMGVSPVLMGSGYADDQGGFTVLTAPSLAPARDAASSVLCWIARNRGLFENLTPDPEAVVFLDAEGFRARWQTVAPATLSIAMALLAEGIAFAFATEGELATDAFAGRPVLVPAPASLAYATAGDLVRVPPGHLAAGSPSRLARFAGRWRRGFSQPNNPPAGARRVLGGGNAAGRLSRETAFSISHGQRSVRELHPALHTTTCRARDAVLVERWRRADGARLLHLVNYSDRPQPVTVRDPRGSVTLHSPDAATGLRAADGVCDVALDTYAVLVWPPGSA